MAQHELEDQEHAAAKADIFKVLDAAPDEVMAVRTALVEGRIDGEKYWGDCSCLKGTIAKAQGRDYDDYFYNVIQPYIFGEINLSPAEIWFQPIKPGANPASSPRVRTTLRWIDEWLSARAQPQVLPATSGVYQAVKTNAPTDILYTGMSKNMQNRQKQHMAALRKGRANTQLQSYYNRFGADSIRFEVVRLCTVAELRPQESKRIRLDDPQCNKSVKRGLVHKARHRLIYTTRRNAHNERVRQWREKHPRPMPAVRRVIEVCEGNYMPRSPRS